MRKKRNYIYTIVLLLNILFLFHSYGQDDSTLYVKTFYKHFINNGRNTAIKFAIKQEMRNSKGTLFREVFYDEETKDVDYVFYYFYDNEDRIRLIEKTNHRQVVIEYSSYSYKKNKLLSIEHFAYNEEDLVAKHLDTKRFKYKKNIVTSRTFDKNKRNTETTTHLLHGKVLSKKNIDYTSDSAHIKITSFEYIDDTIVASKTEHIISKKSDTLSFFHEYIYDTKKNRLEKIITYSDLDKNNLAYETILSYFSGGSIRNKKKIAKNNYYLENITIKLNKYHRVLPTKKPLF